MSIQEAAATRVPAVSSDLVPFAVEYLLGKDVSEREVPGAKKPLKVGAGAIVATGNDVEGFAAALRMLLTDDKLRNEMGKKAFEITIPYFTWPAMTKGLLDAVNVTP